MYYYREHLKYNPAAEHYLVIGPYGHFGAQGYPDSVYNGYTIDAAANIPLHEIIYQWFDYVLRGASRPGFLKDRVNYQVMGTDQWRHVSSLDKMSNDSILLYFSDPSGKDGPSLRRGRGDDMTRGSRYFTQEVDFRDRQTQNNYYYFGRLIYDSLNTNHGTLLASAPLEKETEFSGNFSGLITAAINKKDMDYSLALFEQMADGRYFLLSYFMGRASYCRNIMKRQLLTPGTKEQLPFSNSYMVSRRLAKGSRLVVVLNINKSPFEQINYGTGKEVSDETISDAGMPLKVKWFESSYIKIPVRNTSGK